MIRLKLKPPTWQFLPLDYGRRLCLSVNGSLVLDENGKAAVYDLSVAPKRLERVAMILSEMNR